MASKCSVSNFVIHEHYGDHNVHYDFRLELNGVLESWVTPKGPSMDPRVKRLAIPVLDHPVSYLDFEGVIMSRSHKELVSVWDTGDFFLLNDSRNNLVFDLKGNKLKGRFRLRELRKDWILQKLDDQYAEIGWTLLPKVPRRKASKIIRTTG